MYCFKCGKEIPENSVFCPFCGAQLNNAAQPAASAAPAAAPAREGDAQPANSAAAPAREGYAQPVNQSPIRKAQYNLLCILGLVISLISLVFNYFGLVGLGGIIVSVIGLVLCNRRRENGRILGVLGVLFGAVSVVTAVLAML